MKSYSREELQEALDMHEGMQREMEDNNCPWTLRWMLFVNRRLNALDNDTVHIDLDTPEKN